MTTCGGCGHPNRPGARFCLECGQALALRCSRCGAELPGDARFCDACGTRLDGHVADDRPAPRINAPAHLAQRILSSRSAMEGERKHVTAMFCDVHGSMDLSSTVDDEQWHQIIDRLLELCADSVYRFEGSVNQFLGDGILALFGAPLAHEDHAMRACYAGLHLREQLESYATELKRTEGIRFSVRIGINSGEVVVGTIGDDLRMDYTAAGHTVGLAQRMEQLAEPGRVYVSEHTASLVEGFFTLGDLGAFDVKGVQGPVRAFELLGLGEHRTRLDVARSRGLSRFVGRRDELATLEEALERTEAGHGQVVTVVGDPGVGKSRLCQEIVERARASGVKVFESHGLSHGRNYPFLPILELLRGYFGIDDLDTPVTARQKIAGSLLLLEEGFRDTLPLVFDFLGVPDPDLSFQQLDPEARKNQLLGVVTRLIHARSDRGPALILIEDLHWLDPSSREFLDRLVEAVPDTRTLLLLNTRPPSEADRPIQIVLEPLGAPEIREMLIDRLGPHESLSGLVAKIADRAAGNPLFVEEIVRALVEGGALDGSAGDHRLVRAEPDVVIPPTVQAIIAARLDRLGEDEKMVLQAAAIIGSAFTEPVLRRVTATTEPELAEAMRALEETGFVRTEAMYPDLEYSFRHPLIQDVTYHSQLRTQRARTHAAVAEVIAELHADRLDERAAVLAHHWERAGIGLEAARWSRRAAEWSGHNDPSSALAHWRRVRIHLADVERSEETETHTLASCIGVMNFGARLGADPDEADRLFEEGRALAVARGDLRSEARLLLVYARLRGLSGDVTSAVEHSVEAARLAEQSGWAGLRMAAAVNMSAWYWQTGELERSLQVATAATLDTPAHPRLGAEHLGYSPFIWLTMQRGRILGWLGRCEEAPEILDRAITLASEHSEREILCWAHQAYADRGWLTGDAPLALAHATRAFELADRVGTSLLRWSSQLAVGRAKLIAGNYVEAADSLERSLEVIRTSRIGVHAEAFVLAALCEAAIGMGQTARAASVAKEAIACASAPRGAGAWARRSLACALAVGPDADLDGAERLLRELLAERLGAEDVILDAFLLADRAEVEQLRGDHVRYAARLRDASRRFRQMGAPRRAAALEARLASRS